MKFKNIKTGNIINVHHRLMPIFKFVIRSDEYVFLNDDSENDESDAGKHWVTLHGKDPRTGRGGPGQHVLISGSGEVLSGAGGKLKGEKLEKVKSESKDVTGEDKVPTAKEPEKPKLTQEQHYENALELGKQAHEEGFQGELEDSEILKNYLKEHNLPGVEGLHTFAGFKGGYKKAKEKADFKKKELIATQEKHKENAFKLGGEEYKEGYEGDFDNNPELKHYLKTYGLEFGEEAQVIQKFKEGYNEAKEFAENEKKQAEIKSQEAIANNPAIVSEPKKTISSEQASIYYKTNLAKSKNKLLDLFEKGKTSVEQKEKALLDFKNEKNKAIAQYSEDVTGNFKAPTVETKLFESDKKLLEELTKNEADYVFATINFEQKSEKDEKAFKEWKDNTALEKAGKYPPIEQPKPDTKTIENVLADWKNTINSKELVPRKDYAKLVPKDFGHIQAKEIGETKFMKEMTDLKGKLQNFGTNSAVGNKKLVEQRLIEELKDKKHFQAFAQLWKQKNPNKSESLERVLIAQWAGSSGDGHTLSCAMQLGVRDAFSLPDKDLEFKALSAVENYGENEVYRKAAGQLNVGLTTPEEIDGFKKVLQEFAHAQYENTQKMFKELGVDHVYLARGMKVKHSQKKEASKLKLQPASSFSTDYNMAKNFASSSGTVFLTKVPVSQVLSSFNTGFGCTNENEVVVLGHKQLKAFAVKGSTTANEIAQKFKEAA